MRHRRARRSFIRTAQAWLGHLMDWSSSVHSPQGAGHQPCLPQPCLRQPQLPSRAEGWRGCVHVSLPGLSLLFLPFIHEMAGHGQSRVPAPLTLALRLPPACCRCWHGQQAGKAAAQHPSSSSPPFPPSSSFLPAAALPSSRSVSRPNPAPESMTDCGERGYFCVSIRRRRQMLSVCTALVLMAAPLNLTADGLLWKSRGK